ncbi:non-specific lipid transfer protein GPI-anchored 4-like [Zingiber officinale]|uniref:non-specific lipid transfer protein GPI-anchored 4-like n=1 Tax=Zingiber officinale TaxID=94328 RepID=UPI001C4AFFFA|nr:non-specific lipid transfer protein GPI-anchored 4-like [Zingiber officinale]
MQLESCLGWSPPIPMRAQTDKVERSKRPEDSVGRAALAVGLMVAACVVAADPEDCSNVLTDLLDCLPYVSNGSNTSSPSAGCCIGVTDVVIGSPACICDALKQARELGVELNTSRVLALPAACDVKEPEIRCGGEIPPASSPLPSRAPSTAPQSSEAPSSPPPSPISAPTLAPQSSEAPSSPPPSPISAPTLTPTGSPPPPPPPPPAPSTEGPSLSPAEAPASDDPLPSDAPQLAASFLLLLAAFAVTSALNELCMKI